ncbi:hypothetical protein ACIBQ1_48635 [Nonomuraea sp. NPDC050153]
MSVDLEHEPIHDLARRVIRLAEDTARTAAVLKELDRLTDRSEGLSPR